MDSDLEAERDGGYATKVGARLRSIRRQKHLSLQDVEASSKHEFKASVLGAYERGERAISVPRLQRLARAVADRREGLARLTSDSDLEVRLAAVDALARIASPGSERVLRRLAERASGDEQTAILEALEQISALNDDDKLG